MDYAVQHYENFPVASILLPRHLRRPVQIIYAFARQADDFADEGHDDPEVRLNKLQAFHTELDRIERGETSAIPLFRDLAEVIQEHQLPLVIFATCSTLLAKMCAKRATLISARSWITADAPPTPSVDYYCIYTGKPMRAN